MAKATRRKQIQLNADGTALDEAYLEKLFKEVSQLYKLHEIEVIQPEPQETKPAGPGGEQANPAEPGGEQASGPSPGEPTKEAKDFRDLGPLPSTSVWLLAVLGAAWIILGTIALLQAIKRRKDQKKH